MEHTSWSVFTDRDTITGETVAIASAGCAAIGLLLTWLTLGGREYSGLDTDHGLIVLGCVSVVAAMTYYRPWDARRAAIALVSGFTVLWVPLQFVDSMLPSEDQIGVLGQLFVVSGIESGAFDPIPGFEYGFGLKLTVLGGLGLLVIGGIELRNRPVTDSWRTEALGAVGLSLLGVITADPDGGVFSFLVFSLGVIGPPVTIYCDLQYVRSNSDWNPRTLRWLIGLVVPIVNVVVGAYYLHTRPSIESAIGSNADRG